MFVFDEYVVACGGSRIKTFDQRNLLASSFIMDSSGECSRICIAAILKISMNEEIESFNIENMTETTAWLKETQNYLGYLADVKVKIPSGKMKGSFKMQQLEIDAIHGTWSTNLNLAVENFIEGQWYKEYKKVFYLVGIDSMQKGKTNGHSMLIWQENSYEYKLFDPNFGIASFPTADCLMHFFSSLLGNVEEYIASFRLGFRLELTRFVQNF